MLVICSLVYYIIYLLIIILHTSSTKSSFEMYSLWQAVKNAMHKAFWDILESELNDDPPVYGQAIRLLEEIREVTLPHYPLNVVVFVLVPSPCQ